MVWKHTSPTGGQSIPAFDFYLAPGVAKSFIKLYTQLLYDIYDYENTDVLYNKLKKYLEKNKLILNEQGIEYVIKETLNLYKELKESEVNRLIDKAKVKVDKETFQAMEGLIANLNTMHSRAGSQVPFSSLNFGTDMSDEGRMVVKNFLLALEEGLGNGETPVFPISIFKMKKGINLEGDKNYDLFKLACRVSAKRLFPNFSNIDAPYNFRYYKEGDYNTEISYMGCRTRTIGNQYDPSNEIVTGRGNLSFTTINLPRLALEANKDINKFYELLDSKLQLTYEQLMDRFKVQANKKVKNFPFLMGQGVWLGSEKLKPDDKIGEVIKQGTLSIGFIGLAETLIALIGKHHGESAEAQELGLKIIKRMRDFCDKKAQETNLNFTCLATPAEGLSGRFVGMDRKRYGVIPGITDKEYYTNSFHVPVYYHINAFDKIDLEAPYHELCNAGHITYIEIDGDPRKNLDAFEKVVMYMYKKGIGYGAINHAVDRDPVCGYVGIIDDVCPRCGRKEGEAISLEMWHRIKNFRDRNCCGNIDEELDRVSNKI